MSQPTKDQCAIWTDEEIEVFALFLCKKWAGRGFQQYNIPICSHSYCTLYKRIVKGVQDDVNCGRPYGVAIHGHMRWKTYDGMPKYLKWPKTDLLEWKLDHLACSWHRLKQSVSKSGVTCSYCWIFWKCQTQIPDEDNKFHLASVRWHLANRWRKLYNTTTIYLNPNWTFPWVRMPTIPSNSNMHMLAVWSCSMQKWQKMKQKCYLKISKSQKWTEQHQNASQWPGTWRRVSHSAINGMHDVWKQPTTVHRAMQSDKVDKNRKCENWQIWAWPFGLLISRLQSYFSLLF